MTKKIPSWLRNNVKNYEENNYVEMTICSSTGNELLEIWFYGDWFEKTDLLVDTEETPSLFVAKDPSTNEEIVIFDHAKHGYNSMFCDTFEEGKISNRILRKIEIPLSKVFLRLGKNIDYEEEKEDYDFDENGKVILVDGRKISWEDVITDGFDYIALFYIDEKGEKIQIADEELA